MPAAQGARKLSRRPWPGACPRRRRRADFPSSSAVQGWPVLRAGPISSPRPAEPRRGTCSRQAALAVLVPGPACGPGASSAPCVCMRSSCATPMPVMPPVRYTGIRNWNKHRTYSEPCPDLDLSMSSTSKPRVWTPTPTASSKSPSSASISSANATGSSSTPGRPRHPDSPGGLCRPPHHHRDGRRQGVDPRPNPPRSRGARRPRNTLCGPQYSLRQALRHRRRIGLDLPLDLNPTRCQARLASRAVAQQPGLALQAGSQRARPRAAAPRHG